MQEPCVPLPQAERDSYHDTNPARCPYCRTIIDAHPASRKDGRWEGWCPQHGTVVAHYTWNDDSPDPGKGGTT